MVRALLSKRLPRILGTAALAALVLAAFVSHRHEVDTALRVLQQARHMPVFAAIVCQLVFFTLTVALHASAFRAVDAPIGWRHLLPVWFTSLFVNLAVPGTGSSAFLADASRRGIAPARTAAALLLVRVTDLSTFALVLAGGLVALALRDALRPAEGLAVIGLLSLIAFWGSGLALARFAPTRLERLLAVAERLSRGRLMAGWAAEQASHAHSCAAPLFDRPQRLLAPLACAFLAHVVDVASLWFLTKAFDLDASAGTVLAAFSVGLLFWIVAITPDGLGAVEGMMTFTFISLGASAPAAAAVTLAFRGLALWLPLLVGAVLYLGEHVTRTSTGQSGLAQRLVAGLTALMGCVNLLSAVQPALTERLLLLQNALPLMVRNSSRLATGLAGFALLILAQGLWRKKALAHRLTMAILAISIVAHLIKGLDWEEALLSTVLLLVLWRLRAWFIAQSDGPTVQHGLRILVGAFLFTLVYGVTGFWLLDRQFSQDFGFRAAVVQTMAMFFEFGNSGLEPITAFGTWFADSVYLVAIATMGTALLALLQPVLMPPHAGEEDRSKARRIVENYGKSSLARLVLLPDKLYWFSPGGSVVGYALVGRTAVALDDPIGPRADVPCAIAGFTKFCQENDWEPAFYQTHGEHLPLYRRAGLQAICVGSEAIVDVQNFSLSGDARKSLRGHVRRMTKAGYTTEVLSAPHAPELLRQLKTISDEWLRGHQVREKRFSLGWYDEAYLNDGPLIVARNSAGAIVAFANIIPEYQRRESTIDLMRQSRDAESGVMDLLFVALFEWAKGQGFDTFNLGLAPLSGVGQDADDPLVERVLNLVYRRGGRFYSFEGLHTYKRKFQPQWEPRYLVYGHPSALPRAAAAVVRADNPEHVVGRILGAFRRPRTVLLGGKPG